MIRALLAGTKTQTRRAIKGVPSWDHYGRDIMDWGLSGIHQETYDPSDPIEGTDRWHLDVQTDVDDHSRRVIRCPYGQPGDLLYVRETWASDGQGGVRYYATDDVHDLRRKRVSIHMPRWASRLTLEITDVRVERLQDISEADAEAEGVREPSLGDGLTVFAQNGGGFIPRADAPPLLLWEALWRRINGDESWSANPWCWALSFKVHRANVDQVLAERAA
jgi:hypothetical protein